VLINLEKLSKKYNLELTGIAHIGAHVGDEVKNYVNLFGEIPIYLFEPQKNIFNKLKENVKNFHNAKCFNFGLGSENKIVDFYLNTNNDNQSSSVLKPKDHLKYHPHVTFSKSEDIEVRRLDDFDLNDVNFVNIDVQGYELEVLRGAKNTIKNIKYLFIEVNRKELYEDCVIVGELDKFLKRQGLIRVETEWWNKTGTWGDAFYVKKSLVKKTNLFYALVKNKLESIKGYFFLKSIIRK
tara:strand:- start:118 stop:834 length:717 start_codon:yes stop_codon:yes gene_type:complete